MATLNTISLRDELVDWGAQNSFKTDIENYIDLNHF